MSSLKSKYIFVIFSTFIVTMLYSDNSGRHRQIIELAKYQNLEADDVELYGLIDENTILVADEINGYGFSVDMVKKKYIYYTKLGGQKVRHRILNTYYITPKMILSPCFRRVYFLYIFLLMAMC